MLPADSIPDSNLPHAGRFKRAKLALLDLTQGAGTIWTCDFKVMRLTTVRFGSKADSDTDTSDRLCAYVAMSPAHGGLPPRIDNFRYMNIILRRSLTL